MKRKKAIELMHTYHHRVLGPRRRLDGLRNLLVIEFGSQVDPNFTKMIDEQVKELNEVERQMTDELEQLAADYWVIPKPGLYFRVVIHFLTTKLIDPFQARKTPHLEVKQKITNGR